VCGTASVSYAVEASPVTLTLSGGKDDAGKEFLVGQQCGASVGLPSGWTATPPPPPYSATAYAWSPGGSADPFKSFTYVPPTVAINGSGHRIDLAAGDKDDPTLACCFAKAGTATVSVTVRAVGPDGTVLNVSASKDASVVRPGFTDTAIVDGVAVVDDPMLFMGIVSSSAVPAGYRGFVWRASVDDTTFVGTGGTHGRWCWVQILSGNTTRVAKVVQGSQVTYVNQVQEFGSTDLGWFTQGLDGNAFLYPSKDGEAPDGKFTANGSLKRTDDYPGIGLDSGAAASYQAHDQFTDYLMYTPPGAGSQPVPLQSFTWWWQGAATYTSGHWARSGLGQGHGALDSNPSFPDWTHAIPLGAGTVRWRNQ